MRHEKHRGRVQQDEGSCHNTSSIFDEEPARDVSFGEESDEEKYDDEDIGGDHYCEVELATGIARIGEVGCYAGWWRRGAGVGEGGHLRARLRWTVGDAPHLDSCDSRLIFGKLCSIIAFFESCFEDSCKIDNSKRAKEGTLLLRPPLQPNLDSPIAFSQPSTPYKTVVYKLPNHLKTCLTYKSLSPTAHLSHDHLLATPRS
jgi:hypothetical protein